MEQKICPICGDEKDLTEFKGVTQKANENIHYRKYCNSCKKDHRKYTVNFKHNELNKTILKNVDSQILPYTKGIYFLLKKISNVMYEIVYIGQSENILSRIGQHIVNKQFSNYSHIPILCSSSLNDIERFLIRVYSPRYNIQSHSTFCIDTVCETLNLNEYTINNYISNKLPAIIYHRSYYPIEYYI
jgi:hypothetical protein